MSVFRKLMMIMNRIVLLLLTVLIVEYGVYSKPVRNAAEGGVVCYQGCRESQATCFSSVWSDGATYKDQFNKCNREKISCLRKCSKKSLSNLRKRMNFIAKSMKSWYGFVNVNILRKTSLLWLSKITRTTVKESDDRITSIKRNIESSSKISLVNIRRGVY